MMPVILCLLISSLDLNYNPCKIKFSSSSSLCVYVSLLKPMLSVALIGLTRWLKAEGVCRPGWIYAVGRTLKPMLSDVLIGPTRWGGGTLKPLSFVVLVGTTQWAGH